MKTIEQAILDRILYIGNEIPEGVANDKRDKFVVLGYPQQIIDETKESYVVHEVHGEGGKNRKSKRRRPDL
jgi:hypothetical protein